MDFFTLPGATIQALGPNRLDGGEKLGVVMVTVLSPNVRCLTGASALPAKPRVSSLSSPGRAWRRSLAREIAQAEEVAFGTPGIFSGGPQGGAQVEGFRPASFLPGVQAPDQLLGLLLLKPGED